MFTEGGYLFCGDESIISKELKKRTERRCPGKTKRKGGGIRDMGKEMGKMKRINAHLSARTEINSANLNTWRQSAGEGRQTVVFLLSRSLTVLVERA
jgi:hypothetical protein